MQHRTVQAEWVTHEAFAPFGHVVEPTTGQDRAHGITTTTTTTTTAATTANTTTAATTTTLANQGTAVKHHHVAEVVNLRSPDTARPNLALFVCRARNAGQQDTGSNFDLPVRLLERHRHSSQQFLPMPSRPGQQAPARFLVIVAECLGDRPDLATLRAFLFRAHQGVSYRPGCWHHPMVALDVDTTFAVLTHEDGTSEDCEEWYLALDRDGPLCVRVPPLQQLD